MRLSRNQGMRSLLIEVIAYKNGWLVSTRELATLLKLSPSTVCRYGSKFEDAGFVFTRAGQRKGGEVAWSVGKPRKS
jgi:DNA-binding transcriptional regulator YhcF (GntR family)